MPNKHHWSASMLLEWVLTRDVEAVLSMADEYGGWRIDDGGAARIQPPTVDGVLRAHTIDQSLSEDERTREAVRRANLVVIPARQEIYDALRSGEIDGWARPNGSGDLTRIEPIQWAGLRFRAVDGHDVALPVDSEGDPLSLSRPLADYLAGTVSASITPTVWPDPVFPAERAMSLWPNDEANPDRRPANWDGMRATTSKSDTVIVPRVYHSGSAGRPTSWYLIEAECRCRWKAGERHPGRAPLESPTEWGRVLIDWLRSEHPAAPAPKLKTVTNQLSPLLRKLSANSPK
jgi:hypothetical protein